MRRRDESCLVIADTIADIVRWHWLLAESIHFAGELLAHDAKDLVLGDQLLSVCEFAREKHEAQRGKARGLDHDFFMQGSLLDLPIPGSAGAKA